MGTADARAGHLNAHREHGYSRLELLSVRSVRNPATVLHTPSGPRARKSTVFLRTLSHPCEPGIPLEGAKFALLRNYPVSMETVGIEPTSAIA